MAWPIFAPEETVRRMACSIDGAEIMTERIVKLVDALKEEVSAEEQNVLGQIQFPPIWRQEDRLPLSGRHRVVSANGPPHVAFQLVLEVEVPKLWRPGLAPKILDDIGAADREGHAMVDLTAACHPVSLTDVRLHFERGHAMPLAVAEPVDDPADFGPIG